MAGTMASAIWAVACGPRSDFGAGRAITEHRFGGTVAKRLAAVGEDCTSGGADQCATALCLHISPDPGSGYVCSTACAADADCPAAWGCVQFYPSADGLACVPNPAN